MEMEGKGSRSGREKSLEGEGKGKGNSELGDYGGLRAALPSTDDDLQSAAAAEMLRR